MTNRSEADRAWALQNLSALADGEADRAVLLAACADWRDDGELRASWHAYHLIGDVMRSEELASDARGDADFLHALRVRMAQEPTVLAPDASLALAAPTARRAQRWSWKVPAAVAAGFMAVAAVFVVTQGAPATPGASAGGLLAQVLGGSTMADAQPGSAMAVSAEPQALVADGQLLRDARLQRYFAAHQQFDTSSALGASSGFLRAATSRTPDR